MSTPLPDAAVHRLRAQLGVPSLIAGRYVIHELAGRGGMGEVYRATDTTLERMVAVKVIAAERGPGTLGERLQREARVLARLEHPGIVPVHDAGALDDGRAYYVMRFVEGRGLDVLLQEGAGRGEFLRVLLRIADVVAFAHERGIVHRDLKPGNVMVGPFGEVLVVDWGIAKVLAEVSDPVAAQGQGAGTPGYMAPEQVSGAAAVDQRADVHALGAMLRELLAAGRELVPRPLTSVVARACAEDPVHRYPTATDLAADLRRWLDGERVLAHREGLAERSVRFVRRHQVAILLLLTYVVVRTVILIWRGV